MGLGGKMRNIKTVKERILVKKQFIIGTLGVTGLFDLETVLKAIIGTSMSTQWNLISVLCIIGRGSFYRASRELGSDRCKSVRSILFGIRKRESKTSTQGLAAGQIERRRVTHKQPHTNTH